jgi:hypothetical protein
MSGKIGELYIVFGAHLEGFNKGISDAQKAMSGVGQSAEGISSKLGGLWKQFAIGQIAANAITKGIGFVKDSLVDSVRAAMESENTQRALASALETTGRNVNAMLPGLVKFAGELQKQTIRTDEAAMSALALLAQLTDLDEEGLRVATQGAAGMATVFKMDLETAARNVAKAMEGNYTMMGRYIPQLKDCKTEEEKHALVMKTMAEWYGRATDETGTFSGSLKQLGNMWDEVKEAVGRAVTENQAIKDLIAKVKDGIVNLIESGKIAEWATWAGKVLHDLVDTFVAVINVVDKAKTGFQMLTGSMPGEKFLRMNKDIWEQIQAGKRAVDDFEKSLKILKPTEEELRKEIEKGPESWEKYKAGIKATDDQLAANKDTIVGWMTKELEGIGLLEKAKETADKKAETIRTLSTRIDTAALSQRDLNTAIQNGIYSQDSITRALEYYSEEIVDTAIPASRDLADTISQAAGTIPDISKAAGEAAKDTKTFMQEVSTVVSDAMRNVGRSMVEALGLAEMFNYKAKEFNDDYYQIVLSDIEVEYEKRKKSIMNSITDAELRAQALAELDAWYQKECDRIRIDEDKARQEHADREEKRQNSLWTKVKGIFGTAVEEMLTIWMTKLITPLLTSITETLFPSLKELGEKGKEAGTAAGTGLSSGIGAGVTAALGAIGMITAAFTGFMALINWLDSKLHGMPTAAEQRAAEEAYKEEVAKEYPGIEFVENTKRKKSGTLPDVDEGYQHGGIAWTPQLARVAETEPEIIMPYRQYLGEQRGAIAGVGARTVNYNSAYTIQVSAIDSQDAYRFMSTKGREALEKIIKENVRGITRILSEETGRY